MDRQLTITFDGKIIGDGQLSLRTISHTIPFLQRAIDKVVLYEKQGTLGKNATLPQRLYPEADLFLVSIEKGSIKLPLKGNVSEKVIRKLVGFIDAPFKEASGEVERDGISLANQITVAKQQFENNQLGAISQDQLIERSRNNEISYARAACLSDLNSMLSPLRARNFAGSSIKLSTDVSGITTEYKFTPQVSKNFSKIIRRKRLGELTRYSGFLIGLEEKKSGEFAYVGTFESKGKREFRILVRDADDAERLNEYNLRAKALEMIGCPLTISGTYDPLKGDVAFVTIVN